MRREEFAVDGGNDCEECDFLLGRGCVVGKEGSREAFPHSIGIKGEHELDRGAGEERCEDGIHCAVDVVKGKDMEEMVRRRVVPSFGKRTRLGCQDSLRQ